MPFEVTLHTGESQESAPPLSENGPHERCIAGVQIPPAVLCRNVTPTWSKLKITPIKRRQHQWLFDIWRNSEYMNIYVSNLAMETTGDELKQMFSVFGEVKHVFIMHGWEANRHETGLHGYIEMNMKSEGVAAINNLNGTIIRGRVINTIEALPLSNKKIEMPAQRQQDGLVKVRK